MNTVSTGGQIQGIQDNAQSMPTDNLFNSK